GPGASGSAGCPSGAAIAQFAGDQPRCKPFASYRLLRVCRASRTFLRSVRWCCCSFLACVRSSAGFRIRVSRIGGGLSALADQSARQLLVGAQAVSLVVVRATAPWLALARRSVRAHGKPG